MKGIFKRIKNKVLNRIPKISPIFPELYKQIKFVEEDGEPFIVPVASISKEQLEEEYELLKKTGWME